MDIQDGDGCIIPFSETGEPKKGLMKCQPDALASDFSYMIDLKTTDNAEDHKFARKAGDYRYPVQPAWYSRVMECALGRTPDVFAFLVIEPEPPFAINILYLEEVDFLLGWQAAERDYAMIERHRAVTIEAQRAITEAHSKIQLTKMFPHDETRGGLNDHNNSSHGEHDTGNGGNNAANSNSAHGLGSGFNIGGGRTGGGFHY